MPSRTRAARAVTKLSGKLSNPGRLAEHAVTCTCASHSPCTDGAGAASDMRTHKWGCGLLHSDTGKSVIRAAARPGKASSALAQQAQHAFLSSYPPLLTGMRVRPRQSISCTVQGPHLPGCRTVPAMRAAAASLAAASAAAPAAPAAAAACPSLSVIRRLHGRSTAAILLFTTSTASGSLLSVPAEASRTRQLRSSRAEGPGISAGDLQTCKHGRMGVDETSWKADNMKGLGGAGQRQQRWRRRRWLPSAARLPGE